MSSQFTREHLKISAAKILQTLGWHSSNSTPLEIITDILHNYIFQLSKLTSEYSNEFGYTEPNLDHLGLAFREMGISLSELEEFVKYVNFGAPATQVCKYPVLKEDQLNFLKPGSKEVVTRPVHIHEHLPPMNPILEGAIVEKEATPPIAEKVDETIPENPVFKKPPDVPVGEFKRIKREDEGSRPTREIISVMMTTSGFLSPAREGRLPEAKTPIPPPAEPAPQPPPPALNSSHSDHNSGTLPTRKNPRPLKRIDRKRDRIGKELFKNNEERVRKNPSKDPFKMKNMKKFAQDMSLMPDFAQILNMGKLPQVPTNQKINPVKFNQKQLQTARIKTEKFNTTITPVAAQKSLNNRNPVSNIDKLHTVPDRKKVNILKKISNVKEKSDDKVTIKKEEKEDPSSPPDLIIDEPEDIIPKLKQFRSDLTIEPIPATRSDMHVKPEPMYFDDSPPGTPSTPKTPDMTPPTVVKEKRKRKPKVPKVPKSEPIPMNFGSCNEAEALVDRPKTPKAEIDMPMHRQSPVPQQIPDFSFGNYMGRPNLHFLANFGGPGLIPQPLGNPLHPLSNPLFPNPFLTLGDFGQNPYAHPSLSTLPNPLANFVPKMEDPAPSSSSSVPEPVCPPLPRTPEPVTSTMKPDKLDKKSKEHKKEKKDKLKKKMKKEKLKAEKKEEKKKIKKKEKREKRKEKEIKEEPSTAVPKLTLKLKSPSPRPVTPDTTTKKLNIKPVVKKESESFDESDGGSNLAKISALVTGPPKSKNTPPPTPPQQPVAPPIETIYPYTTYVIPKKKHKPEIKPIKLKVDIKKEPVFEPPPAPPSKYIDAEGNEVWICPACSRQDDGSPMIGCDGCDAWYHWVCVGIQVPPDENENWYCRHCLLRKDEDLQSDKKKKRKRKDKKEHQ